MGAARGPEGGEKADEAWRRLARHDHALGGGARLGSRQITEATLRLFKNFNFRCTWTDGWTNTMLKLDEYEGGPLWLIGHPHKGL